MRLLGVSLREISLKREDVVGEIRLKNVKNNINVVDITLRDISPDASEKALVFTFEYRTDYELSKPKDSLLGSIFFVGDAVFSDTKKEMDRIVKLWKKSKKVDDKVIFPVLQAALNLVNIEAIYLSKKVLLPSPIRLPQIQPQKKD